MRQRYHTGVKLVPNKIDMRPGMKQNTWDVTAGGVAIAVTLL